MKAILNNRVYNTETSRVIGVKGYDTQLEQLYQKRNGEMFVYTTYKHDKYGAKISISKYHINQALSTFTVPIESYKSRGLR